MKSPLLECLGKFDKVWNEGKHWLFPGVYRIAKRVSLQESSVHASGPVATKDDAIMEAESRLFYRVVDAKKFTYGVQNYYDACTNLIMTTLRNFVGELKSDEVEKSIGSIEAKAGDVIADATKLWGVEITKFEIKDIMKIGNFIN